MQFALLNLIESCWLRRLLLQSHGRLLVHKFHSEFRILSIQIYCSSWHFDGIGEKHWWDMPENMLKHQTRATHSISLFQLFISLLKSLFNGWVDPMMKSICNKIKITWALSRTWIYPFYHPCYTTVEGISIATHLPFSISGISRSDYLFCCCNSICVSIWVQFSTAFHVAVSRPAGTKFYCSSSKTRGGGIDNFCLGGLDRFFGFKKRLISESSSREQKRSSLTWKTSDHCEYQQLLVNIPCHGCNKWCCVCKFFKCEHEIRVVKWRKHRPRSCAILICTNRVPVPSLWKWLQYPRCNMCNYLWSLYWELLCDYETVWGKLITS